MTRLVAITAVFLLAAFNSVEGRGSSGHSSRHSSGRSRSYSTGSRSTSTHYGGFSGAYSHSSRSVYHRSSSNHYHSLTGSNSGLHFHSGASRYALGVARDSHGRIGRSF